MSEKRSGPPMGGPMGMGGKMGGGAKAKDFKKNNDGFNSLSRRL